MDDASRFATCKVALEGWFGFLRFFPQRDPERDRVTAALVLGEVALAYKSGLLVCQGRSDGTMKLEASVIEEKLRHIVEELEIPLKIYRFLWVWAERDEMAVVRALMPNDPMPDPRDLWQDIEDGRVSS